MHNASKLGSFMALRANGWSLAKISKELNISKSTLWEWDNKQQNEIHLLKHLQLEKLQERYLPTYEEELSKLRSYLDRLEVALESQDFSKMGPEYVLQMALQLRARLGKMREQVPLRNIPFNQPLTPLPFTGCVSRQDAHKFREEFLEAESVEDPAAEPVAASRESADTPAETTPIGARTACPPEALNSPDVIPNLSGNEASQRTDSQSPPPVTDNTPVTLRELRDSVVNPEKQNRTFPDETPPGSKNNSLKINGFHKPNPNGRPVFNSENGHANVNGRAHTNGHPHANGNGAVLHEARQSLANPDNKNGNDRRVPASHVHENGVPVRFRKKNS